MSRSVWSLVALSLTLWGCVEAQSCGYSGRTYDCDNANQTSMPSSFLSSTTEVRLYDNQITSIPVNAFQGLTALEQLMLYDNQITSIPVNAFQGLTALTYLILFNNQITSIPVNAFQGLTALYWLMLYGNQITSIPENIFQGLTALNTLSLFNNQITSIPVNAFQGLTALEQLYLNNNQITSIPVNAFQGLTALNTLYWTRIGTNNPLICSTAEGNWQQPFVCSSCRNGREFYQNSQFYMCSASPTPSPTVFPTILPTVFPTILPTVSPSQSSVQSSQSDTSDSSLYFIIGGVIVLVLFICVTGGFLRYRRGRSDKTLGSGSVLSKNNYLVTFSQKTTNVPIIESIIQALEARGISKDQCFYQHNIDDGSAAHWQSQWGAAAKSALVVPCIVCEEYVNSGACCTEWNNAGKKRLPIHVAPLASFNDVEFDDDNGKVLLYIRGGKQMINHVAGSKGFRDANYIADKIMSKIQSSLPVDERSLTYFDIERKGEGDDSGYLEVTK